MTDIKTQILEAFKFRHACKEFDANKKIPKEDFNLILEAARLSPSSFGFEPWKFIILQNPRLREKIKPVCWGAQGQLPTASHFVIILARKAKDLRFDAEYLKKYLAEVRRQAPEAIQQRLARVQDFQEDDFKLLENDRAVFDWACKQTYIALANMLTCAALLKIDSCPVEGFNRDKLEAILEKEKLLNREHFGVSCMAAFGYRKNEQPPKFRQALEDITEWV